MKLPDLARVQMLQRRIVRRDLPASFVVFLVALPLCLGIAIASGMPPERGLVSGIVGGLVAGTLAGSPLTVSGPAAGLTTLVFSLVSIHGIAALGPIVLLAGLLQLIGGAAGLGRLVRFIPHSVVEAMLAAIGLILAAAQALVMADAKPGPAFSQNLGHLPASLWLGNHAALALGCLTAVTVIAIERFHNAWSRAIPASVVGVGLATAVAAAFHLTVAHVTLPASLRDAVAIIPLASWPELANPALLGSAVSLALIASIESLLSAAAVSRLTPRGGERYSKELMAQGIGNMVCGFVGALPMTGVIVRSAANVQAGARSRASTILHGLWLLLLVVLVPGLITLVPTASLAGLLVVIGLRMVNPANVMALLRDGWQPVTVYVFTAATILATNLLTGVLAGLALHAALQATPTMLRRAWPARG
jgi:MFS superfamily sulfate permease-like transporter